MNRGTRLLLQGVVFAGFSLAAAYFWAMSGLSRFYAPETRGWVTSRALSIVLFAAGCLGVWLLRRGRPKPGKCPRCEYDLSGLPAGAPCPECGKTPPSVPTRP